MRRHHDKNCRAYSMPDTMAGQPQRFATRVPRHDNLHSISLTSTRGRRIPLRKTHVMNTSFIQGTADYMLNRDWVP